MDYTIKLFGYILMRVGGGEGRVENNSKENSPVSLASLAIQQVIYW